MTVLPQIEQLKTNMSKDIVGQTEVIDHLLISLLINGNLLMEGLPGLAKTRAIKSLSNNIDCDFNRIQFTPDLTPQDVTGREKFAHVPGNSSVSTPTNRIYHPILQAHHPYLLECYQVQQTYPHDIFANDLTLSKI